MTGVVTSVFQVKAPVSRQAHQIGYSPPMTFNKGRTLLDILLITSDYEVLLNSGVSNSPTASYFFFKQFFMFGTGPVNSILTVVLSIKCHMKSPVGFLHASGPT